MPESLEVRHTFKGEIVEAGWTLIDRRVHGRHIRFFELGIPLEMEDREAIEFAGRIIEAGFRAPVYSTFGMIARLPTPEDPTRAIVSVSVDEKIVNMSPSGGSTGVLSPEETELQRLVEVHYRGPIDLRDIVKGEQS